MTTPRWRPGRKVGRTLYIHPPDADNGQLVGLVDTPELAAAICDAMNGNADLRQRAEIAERAARVFCDQRDDARSDAASAWQNAEDWHEVAQAKDRRAEQAEALLREFVSDTPCDPHPGNGFCQTHGERKPCPQAQAKALLAALDRPEGPQ